MIPDWSDSSALPVPVAVSMGLPSPGRTVYRDSVLKVPPSHNSGVEAGQFP